MNLTDLIEKLSYIIEERIKHCDIIIAQYKILESENENKTFVNLYSKMLVVMLYAILEGGVKSMFDELKDFLHKLGLNSNEVNNNIFNFSIIDSYDYLKGKQSFEQKCDFTKNFKNKINTKLSLKNSKIDTKSNLNYEILKEILNFFGIDNKNFKQFENKLEKLIRTRNFIAHGENHKEIQLDEITDYHKLLNDLFMQIYKEIINYLEKELYKDL